MEIFPTLGNAKLCSIASYSIVGMVYKRLPAQIRKWHFSAIGPVLAPFSVMLRRLARLFVIRTRWEAWAIIYALAVGATTRGWRYMEIYPGFGGYLLFLACTGAVFMGGAKILDAVPRKWRGEERRCTDRRRAQAPRDSAVEL